MSTEQGEVAQESLESVATTEETKRKARHLSMAQSWKLGKWIEGRSVNEFKSVAEACAAASAAMELDIGEPNLRTLADSVGRDLSSFIEPKVVDQTSIEKRLSTFEGECREWLGSLTNAQAALVLENAELKKRIALLESPLFANKS